MTERLNSTELNPWMESYDQPGQHIKNKSQSSQGCGFFQ